MRTPGPRPRFSARKATKYDSLRASQWRQCYALDASDHISFALVIVQMNGDKAPDPKKVARVEFIVEACNNYERVCAERDELASAARRLLAELSTSDSETQVNLWKEIQAMERALAELKS